MLSQSLYETILFLKDLPDDWNLWIEGLVLVTYKHPVTKIQVTIRFREIEKDGEEATQVYMVSGDGKKEVSHAIKNSKYVEHYRDVKYVNQTLLYLL